jgi:GNAT superfamily N-acetyltransferase
MARAIAETKDLLVVDEFTSVVDRQVAKIAANSVQKIVRNSNKQFVAVSCHFDIIDWLQPDWIYDADRNTFTEQCLRQRPQLELKIYQGTKQDWQIFKKYHYMSAELHNAAQCFVAYIDDNLVGFIAYIHLMHPKVKDIKMVHRLVVLPDYQGLGIGGRRCFEERIFDRIDRLCDRDIFNRPLYYFISFRCRFLGLRLLPVSKQLIEAIICRNLNCVIRNFIKGSRIQIRLDSR